MHWCLQHFHVGQRLLPITTVLSTSTGTPIFQLPPQDTDGRQQWLATTTTAGATASALLSTATALQAAACHAKYSSQLHAQTPPSWVIQVPSSSRGSCQLGRGCWSGPRRCAGPQHRRQGGSWRVGRPGQCWEHCLRRTHDKDSKQLVNSSDDCSWLAAKVHSYKCSAAEGFFCCTYGNSITHHNTKDIMDDCLHTVQNMQAPRDLAG